MWQGVGDEVPTRGCERATPRVGVGGRMWAMRGGLREGYSQGLDGRADGVADKRPPDGNTPVHMVGGCAVRGLGTRLQGSTTVCSSRFELLARCLLHFTQKICPEKQQEPGEIIPKIPQGLWGCVRGHEQNDRRRRRGRAGAQAEPVCSTRTVNAFLPLFAEPFMYAGWCLHVIKGAYG